MPRKRSDKQHDLETKKAIKMGEQNLDLIRNAHSWCSNIKFITKAEGMYAEIFNLPIGSYQIACPHAENSFEASNLALTVPDFVIKSCENCSHQKPNGNNKWGLDLITNRKKQIAENEEINRKSKNELENIRNELSKFPKENIINADLSEKMILEFLIEMYSADSDVSQKAIINLLNAAEIGSDLFTTKVLDFLFEQLSSVEYSGPALRICLNLVKNRADFASYLLPKMETILEKDRLSTEDISQLLITTNAPLNRVSQKHIQSLILRQFRNRIPFSHSSVQYKNTDELFVNIYREDKEKIVGAFTELLNDSKSKERRVSILKTISKIQDIAPTIGLDLINTLVASLYFEEDHYDETSCGQARICLGKVFVAYPNEADLALSKKLNDSSTSAEIVDTYDQFLRNHMSYGKDNEFVHEDINVAVNIIVKRCLEIIPNDFFDLDTRLSTARAIHLIKYFSISNPEKSFDSLLGYYTSIVFLDKAPGKTKLWTPGPENVDKSIKALESYNENQTWGFLKSSILEVIQEIGNKCQIHAFDTYLGFYNSLDEKTNELLKSKMITFMSSLHEYEEIFPKIFPPLMNALTNFSSATLRVVGIDALVEIFKHSHDKVPENIIEILLLHFRDQYKAVHLSAIEAFERIRPALTETQQFEALSLLTGLVPYYSNKEGTRYMKTMLQAMISISKKDPHFLKITVSVFKKNYLDKDFDIDNEILRALRNICSDDLPIYKLVALTTIKFLKHDMRNAVNGPDLDREDAFRWLRLVPEHIFESMENELIELAQLQSLRDPWECTQIANLFNQFHKYKIESEIFSMPLENADKNNLQKGLKTIFKKLMHFAMLNSYISSGERGLVLVELKRLNEN